MTQPEQRFWMTLAGWGGASAVLFMIPRLVTLGATAAAWVQAVGSVAALIGTGWAATEAAREAKRAHARLRAQIRAEARRAIIIGRDVVRDVCLATGMDVDANAVVEVRVWREKIAAAGDALNFCSEQKAATVGEVIALRKARRLVAFVGGEFGRHEEGTRAGAMLPFSQLAERQGDEIDGILSEFDAEPA